MHGVPKCIFYMNTAKSKYYVPLAMFMQNTYLGLVVIRVAPETVRYLFRVVRMKKKISMFNRGESASVKLKTNVYVHSMADCIVSPLHNPPPDGHRPSA